MSTIDIVSVLNFNHRTASRDDIGVFLTTHGIMPDTFASMNDFNLRIYTGRKRRRLLKSHNEVMTESIDPHSLNDFKDTIKSMENKGYGPKSFLTFVAFLKSIEGKLVIPRHTTNINGCRGLVGADGKCSKCTLDNLTPEWAFQMRLCLTDLKDPSSHLELFGYGALAKFFFGNKTAEQEHTAIERMAC